jgi:RNA polymerase sigma-70 factor, ECF subfamily
MSRRLIIGCKKGAKVSGFLRCAGTAIPAGTSTAIASARAPPEVDMSIASQVSHDALDEIELVRLAQLGEGDAFRVIMQRGNQQLYRVARGIVHDDAEAEDVVQETYARAFAALGDFRGEASVMTWLTRIALNEARGRLRSRRTMVGLNEVESAERAGALIVFPTQASASDPEVDAARTQIRALIERAVDDLPEGFRMVFIMRDVQGCSGAETAACLDIKPETVKTRLHRARRLLREALDDELATALTEAFPFLGVRCQRITTAVLQRLANEARLH